ncbi:hypothetical protein TGAM01_v209073 [Trichoderma gamsii]|uniref:Uncharacterized protein n=1 Tax=Trichoderma gamsii TaxID=398673 RepID=A0A2K0T0Q5_9HYPO|nr:hypothetical protein TGAM01_v209073 [Trichoderma gamsii]PNP39099.1 hypothetical protein TGAMA5MH_08951 [Trichoderma gamsii]PON22003.1 hypothetical protein TGAM01_v209073 [Trichoderma gamsii]
MGQSLFERIQAKLELFRLEQRYTRRRHRRSTFVSNAVYVDGEYVYQTPNSTGSSSESSNASRSDALHGDRASPTPRSPMHSMSPEPTTPTMETLPERKKLNRFSSMPGFGSRSEEQRTVQRRTSMIR